MDENAGFTGIYLDLKPSNQYHIILLYDTGWTASREEEEGHSRVKLDSSSVDCSDEYVCCLCVYVYSVCVNRLFLPEIVGRKANPLLQAMRVNLNLNCDSSSSRSH